MLHVSRSYSSWSDGIDFARVAYLNIYSHAGSGITDLNRIKSIKEKISDNIKSDKLNANINYVGVEAYPVIMDEVKQLQYPEQLSTHANEATFIKMHELAWENKHAVTSNFSYIILFILMPLVHAYSQNYGRNLFSKSCTMHSKSMVF